MSTQMSGGQAAIESLKAEDVNHVFGLIGSATMEMFDALYDACRHQLHRRCRDERTGTHMADGYARASGRAGVILAGPERAGGDEPGDRASAQAQAAFSPVVSIAGALLSQGHDIPGCVSGGRSAGAVHA